MNQKRPVFGLEGLPRRPQVEMEPKEKTMLQHELQHELLFLLHS